VVVWAKDPAEYWPTTASSLTVYLFLHQTMRVDFGFYRAPVLVYLPVVVR
jgi:hypothetical protein